MLRTDRRIKNIDAVVKPFINREEHGYCISFNKPNFISPLSFALNKDRYIVVYTDNTLKNKKLFNSDSYEEAEEFIVTEVLSQLKKNVNQSQVSKYNAL
jgi:hypothetical protein